MKKNSRIIVPLLSILLSVVFMALIGCGCSLSSCESQKEGLFEDGYFILETSDYSSVYGVSIVGLTDKGLEQKIIVVPEYIDGRRVRWIGEGADYRDKVIESYGMEHVMFNSQKLTKVFVPFNVEVHGDSAYSDSVMGHEANCTVIIMSLNSQGLSEITNDNVKVSTNCYFKLKPWYKGKGISNYNPKRVNPANVTFLYNYDVGNNEVYWVDDYDGELISYVPKNPVRSGYIFAGWYKEPECINKWDFSNDLVPQKVFQEEANGSITYNFSELKLYAKWQR